MSCVCTCIRKFEYGIGRDGQARSASAQRTPDGRMIELRSPPYWSRRDDACSEGYVPIKESSGLNPKLIPPTNRRDGVL